MSSPSNVICFVADRISDALAQMEAHFGDTGAILSVRFVDPGCLTKPWQHSPIEVVACPLNKLQNSIDPGSCDDEAPISNDQTCRSLEGAGVNSLLVKIGDLHEQLVGESCDLGAAGSIGVAQPCSGESMAAPFITAETFKSLLVDSCSPPLGERSGPDHPPELALLADGAVAVRQSQTDFLSLTLQKAGFGEPAICQVRPLIDSDVFECADETGRKAQLRAALSRLWKIPQHVATRGSHLLVGPPGSGKTTVLSKWLAQLTLLGGASAFVWRLDGRSANTAEALSLYCDVLGVPVGRAWNGESQPVDLELFDLPGTDWCDSGAMSELAESVGQINPSPAVAEPMAGMQVHLVLNAAYETPLLLAQLERFSLLPITDIIFTHFDEPLETGRLWNVILPTSLPVRFLSAGQNVPGFFREATPEQFMEFATTSVGAR